MTRQRIGRWSRREFLAAGAVTLAGAPAVRTSARTSSRVGAGDHQWELIHDWAQLPDQFSWQTTHNVAVDEAGNLYVIHEGHADKPDHPSIFVFDPQGRYIRSFGQQFQGGGHGIEIRKEGNEEFIYVAAYLHLKTFAKLNMQGEVVWQQYAPMQSGVYRAGEDKNRKNEWGKDRFLPTNFAFLDDGGFLLADGYGSCYIHRYDAAGKWLSCFGGRGPGEGTFNTAHGIWIDRRPGREPRIVVTDRAHHTLQYFTMDGKYLETIKGFGLPANIDTWKDLMVVPELVARVSVFDAKNNVVAQLGSDVDRILADKPKAIRRNPSQWRDGRFVHPHDACFGSDGSIYVAEWVASGRVSKLQRVS